MEADGVLRKQLFDLLHGGNAHMPFAEAVADFPPEAMNQIPPNMTYSAWQLLEHLRITQRDILNFIRDPNYVWMKWPDDYWPPKDAQADEAAWNTTVTRFLDDLKSLEELVHGLQFIPHRGPAACAWLHPPQRNSDRGGS